MKGFRAEIRIEAPASRVWAVLTDFDAWPQWNPFVAWFRGRPEPGARIRVFIIPWSAGGTAFPATLIRFEPGREMTWRGAAPLLPFLFSGEHRFRLEPEGETATRLIHEEVFRGLLVPIMSRRLERRMSPAYARFNEALKARVESGA